MTRPSCGGFAGSALICSITLLLFLFSAAVGMATTIDGSLRMEVVAAPNFVVDSNVESPSSKSPSAAHVGVKIFNDGPTALTNVQVIIGRLTNPAASTGTPAVFETTTVNSSQGFGYSGTFALQMPGGGQDAVRTIPRIEPGSWAVQYFFVTYPLKDSLGKSVTGSAPNPADDLSLNYDIWVSAQQDANVRRVAKTSKATMRNEISASANKIWPNTASKVPSQYLDAIQASLGWRPSTTNPRTGSAAVVEGIWYDLGNVGAGFDNNGDGVPDRNAWLQPVGDPSRYSPTASRMVKAYGLVVVKLRDGTEKLIPFEDQLYFTEIPANNTGAVGLVFYEFISLSSSGRADLSPYQEVASGHDNEKFNGDYGTTVGSVPGSVAQVNLTKSGPATISTGSSASYSLTASNTGTSPVGDPSLSLPLVFEDQIPTNLGYVAGSATSSNTLPVGNSVVVSWSTDSGATWSSTEPATGVTTVRWTLGSPLLPGATAVMRFQASVPSNYPTFTIANTGELKLGSTGSLATSTATTLLSGNNSVGSLVWKDDDRSRSLNGTEVGIPNVKVTLYQDSNSNGALDPSDLLYGTTNTGAGGTYSFTNLPDGRFLAVVDQSDTDLPSGFTLPNLVSLLIAVDLDSARLLSAPVNNTSANWPFISALEVKKTTSPTTYNSGDLVTYTIDLENHAAVVAPKPISVQTAWATSVTGLTAQNASNAVGIADGNFARIDWAQSSDFLETGKHSFPGLTGTITKVELLFNSYLSAPMVNDELSIQISTANTVTFTNFASLQKATQVNRPGLDSMLGQTALRTIDITSIHGVAWTPTLLNNLAARFAANKLNNADGVRLWIDNIGFRVTVTPTQGGSGSSTRPSTLRDLPLVDTFDSTRLAYVSATVAPSSVGTGTITWNNLGPLDAGQRRTIEVTFRALKPVTTSSTVNTATSTGAVFVSGVTANTATGSQTITVQRRATVGDRIWADLNGNGQQDVGEPGLFNVRVSLSNSGMQTLTDANGNYFFRGLPDGFSDTVVVDTSTLPASFVQTGAPASSVFTIPVGGADILTMDYGYRSTTTSVISGFIFEDSNNNQIRDANERFLSGVRVTLSGSNFTSIEVTTDSNGFYRFSGLANRLYTVTVTAPSGMVQTLDPDSTLNNQTTVDAVAGNFYNNRNFAYRPVGTLSIGTTVYYDWNGNGAQDNGENGIPNIPVLLYRDANGDGQIDPTNDSLVATSTTNASGVYGFSDLPAGTYVVAVSNGSLPSGLTQTQDYDAILDHVAVVNLTSSLTTVNFGYLPSVTGSIGDRVFVDSNGDGMMGVNEVGIPNVGVTLYRDSNNNGILDVGIDAVSASTMSGADGSYLFTGLPPGRYFVDVNQNAANIPTDASGNKFSCTTSDPHNVLLAAGQSFLAADFGFVGLGSIGDVVFYDSNGNGTQDYNEPGIPNVRVELYAQSDLNNLLAFAITSSGSGSIPAGFYQFGNLRAGTYHVKVVTITLPQFNGQPIPQTADPDRDGIPVGDNSIPGLPAADHADSSIILSVGASYTGADFGYRTPSAIGDFVWLDLNKDGIQDAGEPGIAGVTLQLSSGGSPIMVTTDPDGYWSLPSLVDGVWTVAVVASNFGVNGPLASMINTYDADGGMNSSTVFAMASGTVNLPVRNFGLDFGYALNGAYQISGTVLTHDTRTFGIADDTDDFFDDGIDQDAGPDDETELAGIEVFIYNLNGRLLGSSYTNSQGFYNFSGLPAGGYRVVISTNEPVLLNSTLTTTTGLNPAVSEVNSSSGSSVIQTMSVGSSNVSGVDFAFIQNLFYDYGDLPPSYKMTTSGEDGAKHAIPAGGTSIFMGSAPDADTNGIATALASGDDITGSDDEDGVAPVSPLLWVEGANGGPVQVNVTGSGWLVGWIDWNKDGDFLDAGELVANQSVTTGPANLSLNIPSGAIGPSSASWLSRFRVFKQQPAFPAFSYTGTVADGEVEDHLIEKPVGGSIGDMVWDDRNGNGLFDASETGIGGVPVRLTFGNLVFNQSTSNGSQDVDGDGVTDPVGYYRFRGLAAGTYTVTVLTPPVGYQASHDLDNISSPHVTATSITTGQQLLTADFGYMPMSAAISGQVRYDTDTSGAFSAPDLGASGVKIQLWIDPDGDGDPSDGTQSGETYTDASGNYTFADVLTGKYVVVEVNPPGSTSVADVEGANDDRIRVTLVGTNVTGRDFLNSVPPLFSIEGTVFVDAVNDNVIGAGDLRVPSMSATLFFDRDGNGLVNAGDTELSSTLADSTGAYSFGGLPTGRYVVMLSAPIGVTMDWDAHGSLVDGQIGVNLTASVTTQDFLVDNYLGSISGFVRTTTLNAGNAPLAGVTLSLLDGQGNPVDGNSALPGVQPRTAVTDAAGSYQFNGLMPGSYQVLQTQPAGYGSVSDKDGGNKNLIGDAAPIVVEIGSANSGNDFLEFLQKCPDLWSDWKDKWAPLVAGQTGHDKNPDGDRYGNLLEYAFCLPPNSGIGKPFCLVASQTPGAVDGVFRRTAGGPLDVTLVLEHATALTHTTVWSAIPLSGANTTVVDQGDGTETVRITDLEAITNLTGGAGFVRIRVNLDNGSEQATATTEVLGWVETGLEMCCRTYSNPFLRCSTFTGTVDAVDGQDLVVTTSAGPSGLGNLLIPGVSYYVEVTSGANEGHRFDVVSTSGDRITVANDSNLFAAGAPFNTRTGAPAGLAGSNITLRRHWTLEDTFPPVGFGASSNDLLADQVQVFAGGQWKIYWLYDYNGAPRWLDAGQSGFADQGKVVLPPGQGMFFDNRTAPGSLLAYGEVRENDFIHPLNSGHNFIGGGYPVHQSANGVAKRGYSVADGFFSSRSFSTADSFFLWNTDANSSASGYTTYYLLDGSPTRPALKHWVRVGDAPTNSRDAEQLFLRNRSVFLRTNAVRSAHKIPSPWTP